MVFQNSYFEKEYHRLTNETPDIEGLDHPYINFSDTIRAYFALADYFTDESSNTSESMLVGVRSVDLLCSALGRQNVSFGENTKYTDPIDVCSTLFYGMVKNHSFSDGNKRTALLILLYQLNLFNYLPNAPVKKFEELVVAVAANSIQTDYDYIWKKYKKTDDPEIKTIAHFLRKNTKKKDHSYHLKITMRDMTNALVKQGVNYDISGGKIHFQRVSHPKWYKRSKTYQYATNFGGWTRSIGPSTARDILSNLDLYDQIPNYQSFIDGNELFYGLIEDFEIPLRRLKDE